MPNLTCLQLSRTSTSIGHVCANATTKRIRRHYSTQNSGMIRQYHLPTQIKPKLRKQTTTEKKKRTPRGSLPQLLSSSSRAPRGHQATAHPRGRFAPWPGGRAPGNIAPEGKRGREPCEQRHVLRRPHFSECKEPKHIPHVALFCVGES